MAIIKTIAATERFFRAELRFRIELVPITFPGKGCRILFAGTSDDQDDDESGAFLSIFISPPFETFNLWHDKSVLFLASIISSVSVFLKEGEHLAQIAPPIFRVGARGSEKGGGDDEKREKKGWELAKVRQEYIYGSDCGPVPSVSYSTLTYN